MKEEEIIQQLKKINQVKPSKSWQEANRQAMLSYIDLDKDNTIESFNIFELSRFWLRNLAQPAATVFVIVLLVFGSSALSMQAARNTKPGDSLYIAKIIHEKTQITLAFSEKKKAKLGLEFAGNRAEELSQVLKETQTEAKDEKVEKLVSNFKKELNNAKDRITKINNEQTTLRQVSLDSTRDRQATEKLDPNKELPLTTDEVVMEGEDVSSEDSQVFSATLDKEERGMQLSDSGNTIEPVATTTEEETSEEELAPEAETTGTSTEDVLPATSTEATDEEIEAASEPSGPEQLINEAQILLESQDYDATLDKLTEAGESIDQVTGGEVKGESDIATTSAPVIEDAEEVDEEGEVLGASEEATSTSIEE